MDHLTFNLRSERVKVYLFFLKPPFCLNHTAFSFRSGLPSCSYIYCQVVKGSTVLVLIMDVIHTLQPKGFLKVIFPNLTNAYEGTTV